MRKYSIQFKVVNLKHLVQVKIWLMALKPLTIRGCNQPKKRLKQKIFCLDNIIIKEINIILYRLFLLF